MTTRDTPEAALATALRDVRGWDDPAADEDAAAILAAMPDWTLVPSEATGRQLVKLSDDLLAAEATIARLRAALMTTADWLDAIIAETEPKPSELMAMVIGLRAALAEQP